MIAMRRASSDANALQILEDLRAQIKYMPQASLTLAGRDTPVVVLKAQTEALTNEAQHALDVTLALADDTQCLSYRDVRRNIAKRARIEDNKIAAVRLTGETKAASWLQDMMVNRWRCHRSPQMAPRPARRPTDGQCRSWKDHLQLFRCFREGNQCSVGGR